MEDIKIKPSPCKSCITVEDPSDCERKNCRQWQSWFLAQWNHWAQLIRKKLQEPEGANEQEA